ERLKIRAENGVQVEYSHAGTCNSSPWGSRPSSNLFFRRKQSVGHLVEIGQTHLQGGDGLRISPHLELVLGVFNRRDCPLAVRNQRVVAQFTEYTERWDQGLMDVMLENQDPLLKDCPT